MSKLLKLLSAARCVTLFVISTFARRNKLRRIRFLLCCVFFSVSSFLRPQAVKHFGVHRCRLPTHTSVACALRLLSTLDGGCARAGVEEKSAAFTVVASTCGLRFFHRMLLSPHSLHRDFRIFVYIGPRE